MAMILCLGVFHKFPRRTRDQRQKERREEMGISPRRRAVGVKRISSRLPMTCAIRGGSLQENSTQTLVDIKEPVLGGAAVERITVIEWISDEYKASEPNHALFAPCRL